MVYIDMEELEKSLKDRIELLTVKKQPVTLDYLSRFAHAQVRQAVAGINPGDRSIIKMCKVLTTPKKPVKSKNKKKSGKK